MTVGGVHGRQWDTGAWGGGGPAVSVVELLGPRVPVDSFPCSMARARSGCLALVGVKIRLVHRRDPPSGAALVSVLAAHKPRAAGL